MVRRVDIGVSSCYVGSLADSGTQKSHNERRRCRTPTTTAAVSGSEFGLGNSRIAVFETSWGMEVDAGLG